MYQHIIAAVDGSTHADKALLQAGLLARQVGARLTVAHIVNLQNLARADSELVPTTEGLAQAQARGRAILEQARQRLADAYDLPAELHLGDSWHGKRDMAQVLARFAKEVDADLLVLATHGRTGLRHMLMGSFIENVMRAAPCPLLVVQSRLNAAGSGARLAA
ncbi:MAG: universal stress protein [Paludibacterium sp.]|uniref:universal stress protein n=1 Tax=Paludibacterium sp. TaxID=1917523 RepID=UPI0025D95D52|nr:universal stress protein [Paludibacterium sp.]MBV8048929.1 universal stress protein [Paludibacterium sp.]MBV8647797.1 universal stress protein [Paludibacterium sp.]